MEIVVPSGVKKYVNQIVRDRPMRSRMASITIDTPGTLAKGIGVFDSNNSSQCV